MASNTLKGGIRHCPSPVAQALLCAFYSVQGVTIRKSRTNKSIVMRRSGRKCPGDNAYNDGVVNTSVYASRPH
jgi:hypothetical protein